MHFLSSHFAWILSTKYENPRYCKCKNYLELSTNQYLHKPILSVTTVLHSKMVCLRSLRQEAKQTGQSLGLLCCTCHTVHWIEECVLPWSDKNLPCQLRKTRQVLKLIVCSAIIGKFYVLLTHHLDHVILDRGVDKTVIVPLETIFIACKGASHKFWHQSSQRCAFVVIVAFALRCMHT